MMLVLITILAKRVIHTHHMSRWTCDHGHLGVTGVTPPKKAVICLTLHHSRLDLSSDMSAPLIMGGSDGLP